MEVTEYRSYCKGSRLKIGSPTDRQFLDTEGEVTVESTSSYPKLPAANTGRKSWFTYENRSTSYARASYAEEPVPHESECILAPLHTRHPSTGRNLV